MFLVIAILGTFVAMSTGVSDGCAPAYPLKEQLKVEVGTNDG